MNGDIVAQRYAKALFALGQQEGMAKLEQYGENLSALEGVLEDSPELVRLFHIPVISVAEKQKVLSQVLDKLDVDPMIKNFCSLLAEKERLPLFEEIAEAFGGLGRCSRQAPDCRKPQQRAAGWHPCQTRKANQQTDRAEVRSGSLHPRRGRPSGGGQRAGCEPSSSIGYPQRHHQEG